MLKSFTRGDVMRGLVAIFLAACVMGDPVRQIFGSSDAAIDNDDKHSLNVQYEANMCMRNERIADAKIIIGSARKMTMAQLDKAKVAVWETEADMRDMLEGIARNPEGIHQLKAVYQQALQAKVNKQNEDLSFGVTISWTVDRFSICDALGEIIRLQN